MSQDAYLSRRDKSDPSSHVMSLDLQRAREPFRLQDALIVLVLAGFAIAVWAYSRRAVKQDDPSDVDEEAREKFEEIPFPPLPPINDDDIRTQVFTHRSFYARPRRVFEDHPDDPSPDNEKFEHLGDTVLGLIVTNLLFDTYPNLRVGPSTKIRALLVSNATLADISRRYQLPARLKSHSAQAVTLMASKNIQANVFESYVGGLYLDQGLSTVEKWLKLLFKPYVTKAYIHVRTQHKGSRKSNGQTSTPAHHDSHHHPRASGTPTTMNHLALFNQQLQNMRRDVEWVYSNRVAEETITTPVWAVRVKVDGEVFGRGRGDTKKAAQNEAAKEGLVRMGIVV